MLLDRGLLRVVLGVVVLGNGVNLAVCSAGRLDGRAAAFVTERPAPRRSPPTRCRRRWC
jgi:multicomponent Na+:H+ antiporter subunit C